MITESRNSETGIYRFEINTTRIDLCGKIIEDSDYVTTKDGVADTISYEIDYNGAKMRAMTTSTRFVLWGENRYAMYEFCIKHGGRESDGTAWMYDDSSRTDYQRG